MRFGYTGRYLSDQADERREFEFFEKSLHFGRPRKVEHHIFCRGVKGHVGLDGYKLAREAYMAGRGLEEPLLARGEFVQMGVNLIHGAVFCKQF